MVERILEVESLSVDIPVPSGMLHPVQDLSFHVDRGETLAIVGESGCGKSLTSLALMDLLPSRAKRRASKLTLEGQDLTGLSERQMSDLRGNRMSMVFQEPMTSLNPAYTIGDQLIEALRRHRGVTVSEARDRAVWLLEKVGITAARGRLRQYPHQLSGGLRQRVMIAMALMCGPDLIIADEPTTALDVTIQAQILELMKELTRKLGVAMIIITHNLGVVARYADRVNVMYAGRIIESGDAVQIYHNPKHPYTLALLRSVPRMDQARGAKLKPVDGQPPDLTKLDQGCAFRPRCDFATEQCARAAPALEGVEPGHVSACWEKARVGFTEALA